MKNAETNNWFPSVDQLSNEAQDFIFTIQNSAFEGIEYNVEFVKELLEKRQVEGEKDEILFHLMVLKILLVPTTPNKND